MISPAPTTPTLKPAGAAYHEVEKSSVAPLPAVETTYQEVLCCLSGNTCGVCVYCLSRHVCVCTHMYSYKVHYLSSKNYQECCPGATPPPLPTMFASIVQYIEMRCVAISHPLSLSLSLQLLPEMLHWTPSRCVCQDDVLFLLL